MMLSIMINDNKTRLLDEIVPPVFFAPKARLNQDAMGEYGLEKSQQEQGQKVSNNADDVDFIERFDGRGRKVKIKMGKIENPHL